LISQLLNNVAGGGKAKKGGRNKKFQRVPVLPDTMQRVSAYLVRACTVELPLSELRDLLVVCFAYIFGWRDSTITTLQLAHVWISEDGLLCFHEDFCKGFQSLSGNPYRNVWYDTQGFPGLLAAFTAFLRRRPASSLDLWTINSSPVSLSAALHSVLVKIDSP
jgi:hypothetical protein